MGRWQKSFSRFKHIFGLNEQGKYDYKQVYYIPGNHDIGYEFVNSQMPQVRVCVFFFLALCYDFTLFLVFLFAYKLISFHW